jgi:hypothetical protein
MIGRLIRFVLVLPLISCAASARSVRHDEKVEVGQRTGVVIGKLGFPSRQGDPILGGSSGTAT